MCAAGSHATAELPPCSNPDNNKGIGLLHCTCTCTVHVHVCRHKSSAITIQSVRQIQKSRLEVALLFATAGNLRGLNEKILNGTQN